MNKIISLFLFFGLLGCVISDSQIELRNYLTASWNATEGTYSVFDCVVVNHGSDVQLESIEPNGNNWPINIWGAFYYDEETDSYPAQQWADNFQANQEINFGYTVLSETPLDWSINIK